MRMTRERLLNQAPVIATGVAVAVALVLITPRAAGDEREKLDALAVVLCVITGLSLAFRQSHPLGHYVVAMGATVTYAALDYPGGPIYGVAFVSALAMVAGTERRTWMPAAFAGGALMFAAQTAVYGWSLHIFGLAAVWFVGTVLFGEVARLRREQLRTAHARTEFAERTREEETRRRVAEERLRIARDVHDVVGHSLATIALQAGVTEHLLAGREPEARESMATIRRLSKEALGEVSSMLAVLRADSGAERAPTPDLEQLTRLVEDMRQAGLNVQLELEDAPVPEVVGGAAYRIVQESLTNVVRHAGPDACARVRVATSDTGVEVEITDDGPGADHAPEGNGMTGMRERAAALGGTFEAGSAPDGGFRVHALLPAR
jgi:signal transduction histidine kinase